jgi:hypothetical protein
MERTTTLIEVAAMSLSHLAVGLIDEPQISRHR